MWTTCSRTCASSGDLARSGASGRRGDRVRIDFDGAIDGQNFAGGKGDNVNVVLGKGSMLKDFEDRLIG
jgi:FKBP-type peptidyl-prolyl cis-trans isomerase (trigger factor)